jgi:hypothetical protein
MSYTEETTTSSGSNTITAFFDERAEADRAVSRLVEAGIPRDSVRVIAESSSATSTAAATAADEHKGFWSSLADLFLPDDDRNIYAEGIRRGGFLITVSGYPFDLHDKALDILDDEGSIDLDERTKAWESEGWSRTSSNNSYSAANTARKPHQDWRPTAKKSFQLSRKNFGWANAMLTTAAFAFARM